MGSEPSIPRPARGWWGRDGVSDGTAMPGALCPGRDASSRAHLHLLVPSRPSGARSDRLCRRVTLGVLKVFCWKHREAPSVTCLVGHQSSPKNPARQEANSAGAIARTSPLPLSAPAGMHSSEPKSLSGDGGSGVTPSPLDPPLRLARGHMEAAPKPQHEAQSHQRPAGPGSQGPLLGGSGARTGKGPCPIAAARGGEVTPERAGGGGSRFRCKHPQTWQDPPRTPDPAGTPCTPDSAGSPTLTALPHVCQLTAHPWAPDPAGSLKHPRVPR